MSWRRSEALKARNDAGAGIILHLRLPIVISRLQRFKIHVTRTWGVAPGFYISRPWRWEAESSIRSLPLAALQLTLPRFIQTI